ncbi:hypothetical protein AKJ16_DCAP21698 [Drosera capensis]
MARNFFNEIRSLKLKDLPDRILPMLSPNNLKAAVGRGLDNYHAKYIETSSVDPLFHVGVELISSVSPRKREASEKFLCAEESEFEYENQPQQLNHAVSVHIEAT